MKTVQLKIRELLEACHQKNIHFYLSLFPNKKIGQKERKELRQQLIQQIKIHPKIQKQKINFDWNKLTKIGTKPECPFASISLSHCESLGVFLFTFNTKISIGFDIEKTNRIRLKTVSRISSPEELQKAPSSDLLWTAKEAGFKCLSNSKNSLLLSDCSISNWRKNPNTEIYLFDCYAKKTNKKVHGTAGRTKDFSLAYGEAVFDLKNNP